MGLRAMRVMHHTETASRTAMTSVRRRDADDRDGEAAEGRAEDVGARPGRTRPRGAAGGVLDGDDLRLEGRERRSLEAGGHADEEDDRRGCPPRATFSASSDSHGQGQGADDEGDAGEHDDRAAVPPVRDVPAEEHEAQGRDGLHEAEQARGRAGCR